MATGDDKRSKYLLSKEALPKIDIPRKSEHARREFALPAALRGGRPSEADPAAARAGEPASSESKESGTAARTASEAADREPAEKKPAGKKPAGKKSAAKKPKAPQEEPREAGRALADRPVAKAKIGGAAQSGEDAEVEDDLEPEEEPGRRGGLFYLLVVALVALVIGVGYWLATRDTGQRSPEKNAGAIREPGSTAASARPDAASPKPPAAVTDSNRTAAATSQHEDEGNQTPAATFSATVETEPAEATVELVGTDLMGTAPMTFDRLDPSREHEVLVSKEGYLSKQVALDPNSTGPLHVKLDAKPRVLRIETVPDGAVVYIERKRVRGKVTPMEEPVPRRLLHERRLKVSIRKPGYAKLDRWVPRDEGWLEETDIVVYNLEGKLELAPKQVKRHARPGRRNPPTEEDGQEVEDGDASDVAPPTEKAATEPTEPTTESTDKAPGDDAPGDDEESPGDEPSSNAGENPADEPPAKELPATPTPDWQ